MADKHPPKARTITPAEARELIANCRIMVLDADGLSLGVLTYPAEGTEVMLAHPEHLSDRDKMRLNILLSTMGVGPSAENAPETAEGDPTSDA